MLQHSGRRKSGVGCHGVATERAHGCAVLDRPPIRIRGGLQNHHHEGNEWDRTKEKASDGGCGASRRGGGGYLEVAPVCESGRRDVVATVMAITPRIAMTATAATSTRNRLRRSDFRCGVTSLAGSSSDGLRSWADGRHLSAPTQFATHCGLRGQGGQTYRVSFKSWSNFMSLKFMITWGRYMCTRRGTLEVSVQYVDSCTG